MLQAADFREIVSGQRRSPAATLLRALFAVVELPYTIVVGWRNRRFDRGRDVHRLPVPVVSVGNLTLGGTGKTPLVEWLARWFRGQDVRVALVSRGYGAQAGSLNDEALELEQKLPDVPHLQNRDRVAAGQTAIHELETELILLDDGFQHRRLARDLDIVVLDATEPFGFEHVFPRGALREPASSLSRAGVVVLSRADLIAPSARQSIRDRVARLAPGIAWVEARHAPRTLLSSQRGETPIASLAGRRVAAFCGIGNPAGFRGSLSACGYVIVELREFPDHHAYDRADIESLARWAGQLDVDAVVTTHKDLVKVAVDRLGPRPLWALVIGMEILAGEADLVGRLSPLARQAHRPATD